jgi:hypothetical protein
LYCIDLIALYVVLYGKNVSLFCFNFVLRIGNCMLRTD